MIKPSIILIVDDIEDNRQILNDLVVVLGHKPVLAENGVVALEQLERHEVDLVLLDLMMPELDGYEVLARIKKSEKTKTIPVIIVSAVSDLEGVERCVNAGAKDYIIKPFNQVLVSSKISTWLNKERPRPEPVFEGSGSESPDSPDIKEKLFKLSKELERKINHSRARMGRLPVDDPVREQHDKDRYQLAHYFYDLGNFEKSDRLILPLLKDRPEMQNAKKLQGLLQMKAGHTKTAIQTFEAIEKQSGKPLSNDILFPLAQCHADIKSPKKAIQLLTKILAKSPDLEPVLRTRMKLFADTLQWAQAAKDADSVIKINGKLVDIVDAALANLKANQLKKVEELLYRVKAGVEIVEKDNA